MKVNDAGTREIVVERDGAHAGLEVQIGDGHAEDIRIVRLTREEARRFAALILFEAARLERPAAGWRLASIEWERRSA